MDSLGAPDTTPTPSAEPDEPAMTPFSLADLGLSEDEIAGHGQSGHARCRGHAQRRAG